MKKIVLLSFVLWSHFSWSHLSSRFHYPSVNISFPAGAPSTVFLGETLRIPVQMNFWKLRTYLFWSIPAGTYLEPVSGYCPKIPADYATYERGTCNMNLVIPGATLGTVVTGPLIYNIRGSSHGYRWNWPITSPNFNVTVKPHPISMMAIPIQRATANQEFIYNLKSAIRYYDENNRAGTLVQGIVNPIEKDGLRFDPASLSITGVPKRSGTYTFTVASQNINGKTESTDLKIEVGVNLQDKPIFKVHHSITSAMPQKKYALNLLDLIEHKNGFMKINQVGFRIDPNLNNPDWLAISSDDATQLIGEVPEYLAGQNAEITLIAFSNTGGDSEPFTLQIPIAYDPEKKPIINDFNLEQEAGKEMALDLSPYITDPTNDANLKIILDKIKPEAPWLKVSSINPAHLEGIPPLSAKGEKYEMTLRANTRIGGSSEAKIISLQIKIDKEKTPQFKNIDMPFPMVYPGQSYFYDFKENRDVYPEYEDAPFVIKFDKGYFSSWLKIENNQLKAEIVPKLTDSEINIPLRITNIPGGESQVAYLKLHVMGYK